MVSYGFDTLEDFYAKSSTRDVIDKVQVPVLFIQVLFPHCDILCSSMLIDNTQTLRFKTCTTSSHIDPESYHFKRINS